MCDRMYKGKEWEEEDVAYDEYFIKEYKKKHGDVNKFTSNSIDLKDQKNKILADNGLISKLISNMDDIFVLKNSNTPIPDKEPTATVVSPSTTTTKTTSATKSSSSSSTPKLGDMKTETITVDLSNATNRVEAIADSYLKKGNELFDKKHYKSALGIYNDILKMIPDHKESLYKIGCVYYQAKKYEESENYVGKGLKKYERDFRFHILAGDINAAQKDYQEAAREYKRALDIMGPDHSQYMATKAIFAKSLYDTGNPRDQQRGCELLNDIVHTDEDIVEGLVGFSYVLMDRQQLNEALTVLIKILSFLGNKESKEKEYAKEKMADIVKEKGVDMLVQQLKSTPQTAPVYIYFANIIKEYGAVDGSVELIKMACKFDQFSTGYALNLIHGLEVCNRYDEAFQQIMAFMKYNRPRGISQAKITCQTITAIFEKYGITPESNFKEIASFKRPTPPEGPTKISADILTTGKPLKNSDPYSKDDLDMLAYWYTIIKIFYVAGVLEPLADMVQLLEPTRKDRDLHLTAIRNEQAYFCCISQLMPYRSLPLPNYRPIYIAGDSHSMSTSWTPLTIQGEKRLFHPLLTTGLKIWHLRPESKFFPKNNFYNVTPTAPKGSEIVFMFGEIDCREGFVVSVERCRYKDIEEGMEVSIDIYIKALKDLISKYKYKIFIHPVVPVLNETRFLVKIFNRLLKQKIMATPGLVFLDFFENLLTPDGSGFNMEYALDGTHMNPNYVALIEKAINDHYDSLKSL
eukprot:gene3811-4741_t